MASDVIPFNDTAVETYAPHRDGVAPIVRREEVYVQLGLTSSSLYKKICIKTGDQILES